MIAKTGRFLWILLIFVSLLHAQAPEDTLGQNLKFAVDFNRFQLSDSLTYFEFYGSIPRKLLTYTPEEEHYRAEFTVDAKISQQDSVIASKEWIQYNLADSLEAIRPQQRLHCINYFPLVKGDYTFSLGITDNNNPDNSNEYSVPIKIIDYDTDSLIVSDVQLASRIIKDTEKTIYEKSGFQVIPHPSRLYGIGMPILYTYTELYNLRDADTIDSTAYLLTYQIYNGDGDLVKQAEPVRRSKPGDTAVEIKAINVATLVSGMYTLVLNVEDLDDGTKASRLSRFFVYRKADYEEGGQKYQEQQQMQKQLASAGSPGIDANRYDTMSEDELEEEFASTRYLSTSDERDAFENLELPAKRQFLKEFWAKRDQSPGTPENEFKRVYNRRVEYANRMFKGSMRRGWRSDRGRILLIYGFPDERELNPFTSDSRAYEVWYYHSIQGGIQFIFVDKRNMGDFDLVHSTARGELYDDDWKRFIDPSGGFSAEQ